jgi:nucleoside-diphosphate-sugar epimerase
MLNGAVGGSHSESAPPVHATSARVAVIGGRGLIGSQLIRSLLDSGTTVLSIDCGLRSKTVAQSTQMRFDRWRRLTLIPEIEHHALATDHDVIGIVTQLRNFRPSVVVHLGNLSRVSMAEVLDSSKANIVYGTLSLAEAVLKLRPIPHFIYASSSMVYGPFSQVPMPESGPKRPVSIYGRLKWEAEKGLDRYAEAGLPLTIIRPTAVYGPCDVNGGIIQALTDSAALGRAFTLRCLPQAQFDFTYVADVVAALTSAIACGGHGWTLNVSSGTSHSIEEAIDIVRDLKPSLKVIQMPGPSDDIYSRRGALDIERAASRLGFRSKWSLSEGIAVVLASTASPHAGRTVEPSA